LVEILNAADLENLSHMIEGANRAWTSVSVSLVRLIRYASGFIRELADCASICARLGFGVPHLRKAGQSRFRVNFDAESVRAIDTDESVAREHSARWSTAQRAIP
jgi:hypothetical protein